MNRFDNILRGTRAKIEWLRPRPRFLVLLLLGLFAGFWLRWDGLDWGRKYSQQFHPDEPRFIEQANALNHGAPLGKDYVFGFGQAIRAVHAVCPSLDYARIGRDVSLVSGILLCLVVFAIARELKFNDAAAALAGALTSLNTLCVIHSHYGTADMTYVLFLYLFALCVLRGWLFAAAVAAGAAMATKFGLILAPSLLWLAWQRRLRGILLLALTSFVFLAVQGFKFDSESIRLVWWSFENNAGGFEHQKWQNIITYLGVVTRALGIPVFIFAVVGLTRTQWREALSRTVDTTLPASSVPAMELIRHVRIIAFLPFALHALGLHTINTAFPRHALPLIPLALMAAAHGIEKNARFRVVAALCLAWSGLLAWSDGRVFRDDPRERAWRELQKTHPDYPVGTTRDDAHVVVTVENNIWRFERSELNPLRAPNEREIYNAPKEKFAAYQLFEQSIARGELKQVFQAGPLHILPEQFLYAAAWGSFEKFAGQCTVYERTTSRQ